MRNDSCSFLRDTGDGIFPSHRTAGHIYFYIPFAVTCSFVELHLFKQKFFILLISFRMKAFPPPSHPPKKKFYGKSEKLFKMGLIRRSLCLLNIYRVFFVLLRVILSHVIPGWCLQSSISLQDTLGVIASLSDNWPSLSLCMWKGKKLVALESSPRAQECTPNTICKGDSLIWLMFLWSFIETAV